MKVILTILSNQQVLWMDSGAYYIGMKRITKRKEKNISFPKGWIKIKKNDHDTRINSRQYLCRVKEEGKTNLSKALPSRSHFQVISIYGKASKKILQVHLITSDALAQINIVYFINKIETSKVSWCSWLSRQSNTLKVSGSNPGDAKCFLFSTGVAHHCSQLINALTRSWFDDVILRCRSRRFDFYQTVSYIIRSPSFTPARSG